MKKTAAIVTLVLLLSAALPLAAACGPGNCTRPCHQTVKPACHAPAAPACPHQAASARLNPACDCCRHAAARSPESAQVGARADLSAPAAAAAFSSPLAVLAPASAPAAISPRPVAVPLFSLFRAYLI